MLQPLRSSIWTILTVANENFRVLCRREMAHTLHRLVLATGDLVASRLAHGRSVRPVVLARQHVHGALLGVNAGHAAATIPPTWSHNWVSKARRFNG